MPFIIEQAPFAVLSRFGKQLLQYPGKIVEGARLRAQLMGTRYLTGTWVESAVGSGRVESVRLRSNHSTWQERCDYLAIAYGLTPNLELPGLLGCEIRFGQVVVNDRQQTSENHVYCAGEPTGVGGVDLALVEGQIAGATLAGDQRLAESLLRQRARWRRFAAGLDEAFRVRPEIAALAEPETVVCRCEDVTLRRLQKHKGWREAKLHTRWAEWGLRQGRICGPAAHHLLGWNAESVRPPVFPITVGALAAFEPRPSNSGDSL